jgi:hypothetical protein
MFEIAIILYYQDPFLSLFNLLPLVIKRLVQSYFESIIMYFGFDFFCFLDLKMIGIDLHQIAVCMSSLFLPFKIISHSNFLGESKYHEFDQNYRENYKYY